MPETPNVEKSAPNFAGSPVAGPNHLPAPLKNLGAESLACSPIFMCIATVALILLVALAPDVRGSSGLSAPRHAALPSVLPPWRCPFPRRILSCAARDRAVHELRTGRVAICLWDGHTSHHPEQLSHTQKPTHFRWDRDCDPARVLALFAVTSETHLGHTTSCCSNDTYSVFLSTEPPDVSPEIYVAMQQVAPRFDLVLSLGGPELFTAPNVMQWPWGASWVPLDQWHVYPKSRLCSIIASTKAYAPGHKLRHEAVAMLRNVGFDCDVLGHGYRPIPTKRDGLADYMFSIVIENSVSGSGAYMTEKIIDALAVGTVPVYWGAESATQIFGSGILPWNSIDELRALLPSLTPLLYASLLPDIEANVDRARAYVPPERWLWTHAFGCAYEWLSAHPDAPCT